MPNRQEVAVNRCDRCRAAWAVEWWKPEGRHHLLLCGHHHRQHGPGLVAAGFVAMTRLDEGADTVHP